IKEVQRKLAALGLYRYTIDGGLGNETKAALLEAFGDESWRTLSGPDAAKKLAAATKPTGTAGEHRFRFGEMFRDGVLDFTLAVGFDEKGHHDKAAADVEAVLTARGFAEDAAEAEKIYTQAGRTVPAASFGKFFVKKDALTYTPPAGTARKVHAVVRLLFSSSGAQGGSVAAEYEKGMSQSDVAYYTGHGRYGTGPDFDPHTVVEVLDASGTVLRKIENYETLEVEMKDAGKKSGRGAWLEFLHQVKTKQLRVVPSTAGNVRLTPANPARTEFGRKLMDWNLDQAGKTPVTGKGNALEQAAQAKEARKYRVLVYDGCNTTSYVRSIHATKGYDTKSTDILGTKDEINWGTEGPALASFLDGIIAQQSAEEITKNMDNNRNVYGSFGTADNPVVPK
ncbi:MAG TPA: hypothetical protein VHG91_13445, partial [Longimicrobium sp.]|nr:hypothetical protein [Longimicrobium sp.]